MGRRLLQVAPEIVLTLITEGNQWGGCAEVLTVTTGVPEGTQLVEGWFDHGVGRLCLLLEHPSWPVTDELGLFPVIMSREQPVPVPLVKEAPNGP